MFYLKDNDTGNKIEITKQKIILFKIIFVFSFVFYGVVASIFLSYIELSYKFYLLILTGLYLIELYAWFSNNFSPGKILLGLLTYVAWKSIFDEILNTGDVNHKTKKSKTVNDLLISCSRVIDNKHRHLGI